MSYALGMKAPIEIEVTEAPIAPIAPEPPWPDVVDDRLADAAPTHDEDKDLLDRLALGEEAAFCALVKRHIDRAYAIALRIIGNPTDAEDVVQDTMLKIWIHRGRWQPGRAKFSTWLYRVISNRCIDLRRKPRTENVDVVPDVADTQPDASCIIERNEASSLLQAATQRLPEQQRIAVVLSYHENMSNSEIAEVMDTTVAAVESLLKRGRQQLRELLRRHERDIRGMFTDR